VVRIALALRRVLPIDHPVIKEVMDELSRMQKVIESKDQQIAEIEEGMQHYNECRDALRSLVFTVDDWRRGLRDWEDVKSVFEPAIEIAEK